MSRSLRIFHALFTVLLCNTTVAVGGQISGSSLKAKGEAQEGSGAKSKPTLWIVPHTHWEGAVFKTREEYLKIGLPHIVKALDLLRTNPDYRFVLDQAAYVKPFLERYPEKAAEFRKFVAGGRLQIVGATDVMLDVNIPSGESWVRQVLYGKGYFRRALGVEVTVGWALDTFGHHAQMPQLLRLAGYHSYWFQRGVHGDNTPSEFLWQGIDGSIIPAFWQPLGYGLFYPAATNLFEFASYARDTWESLGPYSPEQNRVALVGADVAEPEDIFPKMVQEFDQQADEPFQLRFAAPSDFESLAARHTDRQVISGELNPVFQGVYSSRIELKQWMRRLERILTTAEKLCALIAWLGLPVDKESLVKAWEPVLFNQAHDLTSGTMVDKVYLETLHAYESSKGLGDEMVRRNLDSLASKVDTRGPETPPSQSVPVLVFNSLGWPRTDIAEVKIQFRAPEFTSLRLVDPQEQPVPLQLAAGQRFPDGSLKAATIAFIARDVPALGYAVYRVIPEKAPTPTGQLARDERPGWNEQSASTMHSDVGSIENEFYRATFDLWTGAMTDLVVKSPEGDWSATGGRPANIIAEEQDGGDLWELYGTLNGGRLTAMTQLQGLPIPRRAHLSDEWVGGDGRTHAGPVFSEFHVSHPFGAGGFSTTVRLYRGVRRLEIQTDLLNNDKFVRYRALFPTSLPDGKRCDEIPFGSLARPAQQEFPAQNWADWSDGRRGVALLNRGLPGANVAQGTLILSLMRSARISSYPYFGGYEPGVSSDLGLELGVKRTFDYALVPHAGDWRQANVVRAALEFNHPFIVAAFARHSGILPSRWGLLDVSQPNVVISSFKPGEHSGLILRLYEASGQRTENVKITFQLPLSEAEQVNLMEDPIGPADLEGHSLRFTLRPYEIKTFKFQIARP